MVWSLQLLKWHNSTEVQLLFFLAVWIHALNMKQGDKATQMPPFWSAKPRRKTLQGKSKKSPVQGQLTAERLLNGTLMCSVRQKGVQDVLEAMGCSQQPAHTTKTVQLPITQSWLLDTDTGHARLATGNCFLFYSYCVTTAGWETWHNISHAACGSSENLEAILPTPTHTGKKWVCNYITNTKRIKHLHISH